MSFTLRSFFEDSRYAMAAEGDVKALRTLIAEVGKNIIDTQTALKAVTGATVESGTSTTDPIA